MEATGGKPTKLTRSSASYWSPDWTLDGKRMLLQSDVNHKNEMFLAPPLGGLGKPIAQLVGSGRMSNVAWLPDGQRMLIGDGGRLRLIDTSGRTDKKILDKLFSAITGPADYPQVSGDRVYFTQWGTRNASICSIKLDGTDLKILTNKPVAPAPPEAPKEQKEENKAPVKNTSAPIRLASTTVVLPSAPTKTQVAQGGEDTTGSAHAGLGTMGPHPGVPQGTEGPPVQDLLPAVSPDGKLVAFLRDSQVHLMGSDGSDEKQLTQFNVADGVSRQTSGPAWSPSGKLILVQSSTFNRGEAVSEIWTVEPGSGSVKLAYSEKIGSEYGSYYSDCTNPPAFTPDGQRILFTSIAEAEPRIVSIALDGTGLKQLAAGPSSFAASDSAGRRAAYVDLSNNLELIRILDLQSGKITSPRFAR